MSSITKKMIKRWGMTNMDWMGYYLERDEIFSYHHLIIPKKDNGPKNYNNGAILIRTAGHDYLHLIERYERETFLKITDVLIDINRQRACPTKAQLEEIRKQLIQFEDAYLGETNRNHELIIKPRYLRRG